MFPALSGFWFCCLGYMKNLFNGHKGKICTVGSFKRPQGAPPPGSMPRAVPSHPGTRLTCGTRGTLGGYCSVCLSFLDHFLWVKPAAMSGRYTSSLWEIFMAGNRGLLPAASTSGRTPSWPGDSSSGQQLDQHERCGAEPPR